MWSVVVTVAIVVLGVEASCPDHVFLGCVLRLKAQRVPFERNMMNVIFNIGTEARLLHTCKVYGSTLPCFREKILECGDDKQRRVLNEVGKMLMFLCSPFSLQRQRLLVKHQECIRSILSLPATTGCELQGRAHGAQVASCRKVCHQQPSNFICLMKTWISEQNVCTLNDIEEKCGEDAAMLYKDMQTTVFDPTFPVLCELEPEDMILETLETKLETTTPQIVRKENPQKAVILKKKKKRPMTGFQSPAANNSTIVFGSVPAKNVAELLSPKTDAPSLSSFSATPPRIQNHVPSKNPGVPNLKVWTKPTTERGNAPSVSSTETTTPRTVKVITLLKSLLPGKLPAGIESLFQYSDGESKKSTKTQSTSEPPTSTTTEAETLKITPKNKKEFSPMRRWRPWYMAGNDK